MGTLPQSVAHQVFPSPALRRPFGVDLAPPRQPYFTLIPAVLALTGIASWTMADEPGLLLSMVVATLISLFSLWDWLFNHAPTRFSTLLGMTLLVGYGAGALNTWITLPRGGLTLGEVVGLDDAVLTRGLAAVLISSACLYFLGEIFERPLFGREFRFHIDTRTRALIYAGTVAMILGYLTHQLEIGGPVAAGGHVSVPGLFLSWLYTPLTAIAVVNFLDARRRVDKVLGGLSALVLLVLLSLTGRRVIIYTAILLLLVMALVGFRWREKVFRNVLVILALAVVMVATSLTFMLLRIAAAVPHQSHTVRNRIEVAGRLVQRGGAFELAGRATQTNFQTRTFVLSFLANILDSSSHKTPALGNDAAALAELAIPSVLDPDKKVDFTEETLVDQQFQLSYGDQPNSVLTAGATDFGLLGMILYPLLIVLAFRAFLAIAAKWFKTVPLMFATLCFINLMLQTEITMTGYFEALRDSLLFGTLVALFLALPAIKLRAS
jgi:hypothetical protein